MLDELTIARLIIGAASTAVYALVGWTVGRRALSGDGAFGIRAFQVWWYGLAILTLFTPVMTLLDQFGSPELLPLRLFLLNVMLVGIMIALGGLLYYLLYVYTGKTWVFWPIALYAALELVWLFTLLQHAHITGYGPDCPQGGFCYENDISGSPASSILTYTLLVPMLLGTIAYFALYFRLEEKQQKLRVAMVAGALAVWFAAGLVASLVPIDIPTDAGEMERGSLNQSRLWSFVISPLISLIASLVIYWAYNLGSRRAEPAVAATD